MKIKMLILMMVFTGLSTQADNDSYKKIIESKYGSELEGFEVISFSSTTKVLSYGWKRSGGKDWWGTFNVIEVDNKGNPVYWYDIPEPPNTQGIERIRVVKLNEKRFLEVIGCTHQGNGCLYLYQVDRGILFLMLECRVMANLSVNFGGGIAKIRYGDLDGDGDDDITIDANCYRGDLLEESREEAGKYHREFIFENGYFTERLKKRKGLEELMDW